MAQKMMVLALTTGTSIVVNGWCDPRLRSLYSQLQPAHQQQAANCLGLSTSPSSPPVRLVANPAAQGGAISASGGTVALPTGNSLSASGGHGLASSKLAAAGNYRPGGTVNPAGAPEAVDLNTPAVGPGGKGFRLGATEHRFVLPRREILFRGIDTQAPETQLAEGMGSYSINFDSFRTPGSLSVRDGLIKLSEDVDTLSPTNTIGLGLVSIPPVKPADGDSSIMLLAFSDTSLVSAPSSGDVSWSVVDISPLGRGIVDARNRPGPVVSYVDNAISDTADITVEGWDGSDEYHVESDSIVAVSAAWSPDGFPTDPEAARSDRSAAMILDRVRWDGYNDKTVTVSFGAAGTYYVTTWAWTYNGRTKATHTVVEIA